MKKNMISTIVCCLAATAGTVMLSAGPLCAPLPFASEPDGLVMNVEAATVGKTKTQAVNWIQNAANTKWCVDVDGVNNCQCVDLVVGYYQFLGYRNYAHGNGKDYAKNAVPAGWKRISKPKLTDIKAGDIVVWGAGAALTTSGGKAHATYGHVGLVLKDGTSKGFTTVETRGGKGNAAATYTRTAVPTCIIRPKFSDGKPIYSNALVDGATYRIRSACGSNLYIGTANNKTAAKTNVQLVGKNDASSLWVAHYNKSLDYWYFTMKSNSKVVLNPFADSPVSTTNINTYNYAANDASQGFLPVKQKDGSFKILNAMNSSVAVEVAGEAKSARKNTNIRLFANQPSSEKTQFFYFDRV